MLKFREEKDTSTSKIHFDVIPFSPPPSYHLKNHFQNHWESFLNSIWTILLLGNVHDLSCTLSPYPWGSHIQPIEGRMRRNNCWAEVRNHIPKSVPECLILRNHSIIAIIFSPIDFKKRLSRRDTNERFHLSTTQDKVKNSTKAPWGK
jgi:hypothetical protein